MDCRIQPLYNPSFSASCLRFLNQHMVKGFVEGARVARTHLRVEHVVLLTGDTYPPLQTPLPYVGLKTSNMMH